MPVNPADMTDEEWAVYLARCHEAELPELVELNNLYEGNQPLTYMHPELLAEIGDQIQQVVVNWPQLVVDAVEERLDVEGFRYPDAAGGDEELWRIWQANSMDEQSQQAHVDALVMQRAFLVVGSNPDDEATPLVTAESPLQMHADYDPATRRVRAGLKRFKEVDPLTGAVLHQYATLYRPDVTVHYETTAPQTFRERDRDEHKLGDPPVVVLPNRGRLLTPGGVSELAAVLPISNAACKIATDMMVSAEYHAMPRRVAFGFDQDDFTDAEGNPVSTWSRLAGRIWATAKGRKEDGADVQQFPEADLKNFHETINTLARIASALAALPPNYFGLVADDAASADAIRSREARLVKRCERKQKPLGGGYERMNRLVMRFREGGWDPDLMRLETLWRDPATPTVAQKADAAVKLHTAKIVPLRQTREDMGYTQVQIARMEEQDERAAKDALARIAGGDVAPLLTGQKQPEQQDDQEDPQEQGATGAAGG